MRSAALEIHSLCVLKGVASGWPGRPKPPPILSPPVFNPVYACVSTSSLVIYSNQQP